MKRSVLSLVFAVLATDLVGCSRESGGERLTRECGEVVDRMADSGDTTNPNVATVKRADMEAVIRSHGGPRLRSGRRYKLSSTNLKRHEDTLPTSTTLLGTEWSTKAASATRYGAQHSTMTFRVASDSASGRSASASQIAKRRRASDDPVHTTGLRASSPSGVYLSFRSFRQCALNLRRQGRERPSAPVGIRNTFPA